MEVQTSSKSRTVDSICSFFNFTHLTVRQLLNWKCGGDEEKFAEKAVETLVKMLKKKKGALEELERALRHPDVPSKCVTIPTNVDGRLQVFNRKALPHVIYCRVWRWPNLQSHYELEALEICSHPYSLKSKMKEICINPYHYKRVKEPVIPAVVIPRQSEFVSGHELNQPVPQVANQACPPNCTYSYETFEQSFLYNNADRIMATMFPYMNSEPNQINPTNNQINSAYYQQSSNECQQNQVYNQENQVYNQENQIYNQENQINNQENHIFNQENQVYDQENQIYNQENQVYDQQNLVCNQENQVYSQDNQNFNPQNQGYSLQNPNYNQQDQSYNQQDQNYNQQNPNFLYNNGIQNSVYPYTPPLTHSTSSPGISDNNSMHNSVYSYTPPSSNYSTPSPGTSDSTIGCNTSEGTSLPGYSSGTEDGQNVQYMNTNNQQQITVPYEEQPFWGKIVYYELATRVGEAFMCNSSIIIVDGYTNPMTPNSQRFSLGSLSNINRNSVIESTRRNIGKGLELNYFGGDIFAMCLAETSIFIQSRISNYMHGLHHSTVCKVPTGTSLKIFSFVTFAELIAKCVHLGFEAVYELTKLCTIRISFVKGWGADYHRQDVMDTPCWIELHIYGALQWLDKILIQMDHPTRRISSVT